MSEYSAKILKLINTNTLLLSIDLGFSVSITQQVTLRDISSPEPLSHGETQAVLVGLVALGQVVVINTVLVENNIQVTLFMDLINIKNALVASGYKWQWDGG